MRNLFMTCACAAALFAMASFAPSAQAMTLAAPAGLSKVAQDNKLTENVAYVCRGGWGWRRCWWTPGWAFYRPAYYYRPAVVYRRPAAYYAFASVRPAFVRPVIVRPAYYAYGYRPYRPWWGWRARRGWW
jgi:hypothetical protein